MLQYTKTSETLPLANWEKIKYGQSIGLDVSKDVICPKCWEDETYTKLATVKRIVDREAQTVFICPTHKLMEIALPEYVIEQSSKYHGQYETQLIERKKRMNQSLVVQPQYPMKVQEAEMTRMRGIVRSAIMGIGQDLGKYTEDVIALVAHGALVHGLNPTTGEIFPYIERDKNDNIKKISLGINYKGLSRSARRQSNFNIPHDHIRFLTPEEIRQRNLHIVPNWEYFRDKSKPPTTEHNPENCIAVEVPLYRFDAYEKMLNLAERAKALGQKPLPVTESAVGLGVWRPGDSIPAGRTAEWRAILRGIKDAIQKAYDLDFALVSMYVDKADEYVDRQSAIVIEAPEGEVQGFSVDEIMTEEPVIEITPQNRFPGELLNQSKQNGLVKMIKKEGIPNPEKLIQEVFGEEMGLGDLTDIMAKNLVEICKRNFMLAEHKITPEQLGYEGLSNEAIGAALKQEALEKSKSGLRLEDAETLIVKTNSEELLEQLPK